MIHPDTTQIVVRNGDTDIIVPLSAHEVQEINHHCITNFNNINSQIIQRVNTSLLELDQLANKERNDSALTSNMLTMAQETLDLNIQTYNTTVQKKTIDYYTSGYKQTHNVLPEPTIAHIKWGGPVSGSGKLGDFIMLIPVMTIQVGTGSMGGGCIIL